MNFRDRHSLSPGRAPKAASFIMYILLRMNSSALAVASLTWISTYGKSSLAS